MSSSDQLTKQILSRLGVEEVEDDNAQKRECPFDCSSKFSMLDELDEDVYRLDSDLTTLRAKTEAHGHIITEFGSHHQALWSDHRQVKGEVHHIKEMVRIHGERLDEVDRKLDTLYALRPIIYENKAKIAKLEEHTNDFHARLDDEKRQRKESDSSLGWLILGLFFLGLVFHQKPEMQARKELTRGELAVKLAREWVQLRR